MKFKCVELYVNDTIFNKKIVKTVNICKTDGDEKTNSLTSYLSSLLLPFLNVNCLQNYVDLLYRNFV